jgi:hypothetical protein
MIKVRTGVKVITKMRGHKGQGRTGLKQHHQKTADMKIGHRMIKIQVKEIEILVKGTETIMIEIIMIIGTTKEVGVKLTTETLNKMIGKQQIMILSQIQIIIKDSPTIGKIPEGITDKKKVEIEMAHLLQIVDQNQVKVILITHHHHHQGLLILMKGVNRVDHGTSKVKVHSPKTSPVPIIHTNQTHTQREETPRSHSLIIVLIIGEVTLKITILGVIIMFKISKRSLVIIETIIIIHQ